MFANIHKRIVEWGDCDPAGIVFYPRFFAMFDAATAFLLEAASGKSRSVLIQHHEIMGWPMVETRAIFHYPVRFDDAIAIESSIQRVGTSSFDVAHKLQRDDILCVAATETRVWTGLSTDGARFRATPIPDDLRHRMHGN